MELKIDEDHISMEKCESFADLSTLKNDNQSNKNNNNSNIKKDQENINHNDDIINVNNDENIQLSSRIFIENHINEFNSIFEDYWHTKSEILHDKLNGILAVNLFYFIFLSHFFFLS